MKWAQADACAFLRELLLAQFENAGLKTDADHIVQGILSLLRSQDAFVDEGIGDGDDAGCLLAAYGSIVEEGEALHLDAFTLVILNQILAVGAVTFTVEDVGGVDAALADRGVQSGSGLDDVGIDACGWIGHVAFVSGLGLCKGGLTVSAVCYEYVIELQLRDVSAGGSDTDDGVYVIFLEQLVGVDAQRWHAHAAGHNGNSLSLVVAGVAVVAADGADDFHVL